MTALRPHVRLLLVAFAAAAVAGCSSDKRPTAPPAAAQGPPLLLAFTSDRPPSSAYINDIYLADLASGVGAFLAPNVNSTSDEGPVGLSGDGRTLAYVSSRVFLGTLVRIALMDVATGALRIPARTSQLMVTNPSLSYDGRYLATNYQVGGDPFQQAIACEDLVADTLLPLPNLNEIGVTNFDPNLNGDGTLISFSTNGTRSVGAFDIVLYSVPGDSMIPLPGLNTNQMELGGGMSADGRYIVFQSGRPGGVGLIDVYLYDRQTSSLVPLPGLNTPFAEVQPAISPDGRYIACMTESEGAEDVRLYDVVEKRVVPLPGVNDPRAFDQYPVLADRPPAIRR